MTFEIQTENDFSCPNFFYRFRILDVGYEVVNLCQKQHTFTIVLLGLGFSIWWKGKEDKKCKKRLEIDLWDDEPQIVSKKKGKRIKKIRK